MNTGLIIGDSGYARQLLAHLGPVFGDGSRLMQLAPMAPGLDRAITQADWIIEMTGTDLRLKREVLHRCAATGAATVTSDSSVHSRAALLQDLPTAFHPRFAVAHFFFPLRHCRLVELVVEAPGTLACTPGRSAALATLLTGQLSREVVRVTDGPAFAANRLAFFVIAQLIVLASMHGLNCAQLDRALAGVGLSKLGVFALADVIGHAELAALLAATGTQLAPDDPLPSLASAAAALLQGRSGQPFIDRDRPTASAFGPESATLSPGDLVPMLAGYRERIERELSLPPELMARIMALGYGWTLGP